MGRCLVATSIIVPGLGDVIKELVKKGAWGILTALGVVLLIIGLALVGVDIFETAPKKT